MRPVIFLICQSLWGAPGSNVLYLPCLCSFPIPCCYLWLCCYGREYFLSLLNNCLAARGAHFSLYWWRISWDVWEMFPVLSSRGELAGPVPSFDIESYFFFHFLPWNVLRSVICINNSNSSLTLCRSPAFFQVPFCKHFLGRLQWISGNYLSWLSDIWGSAVYCITNLLCRLNYL